jgi:hypothetical protein
LELSYITGGTVKRCSHVGNIWRFFKILCIELQRTYDSTSRFILSKNKSIRLHRKVEHTWVFIEALFKLVIHTQQLRNRNHSNGNQYKQNVISAHNGLLF